MISSSLPFSRSSSSGRAVALSSAYLSTSNAKGREGAISNNADKSVILNKAIAPLRPPARLSKILNICI